MKNKIIWGIIIIAIVIIAGLYVRSVFEPTDRYMVAPRQDDSTSTTDWKTYTNEKYGFEFKYPNTFEILENDSGISIIHPEDKKNLEKKKPLDGIWINIMDNKDKLSVTDWWNKYGPYTTKESAKIGVKPDSFPIEKMIVDGVDGIYIGGSEGVLSNYLILPDKEKIFEINLMANDFMTILSTFKFTK